MPNYGDTRNIQVWGGNCQNNTKVKCTQKQVYRRRWYFLWLWGAWVDEGNPICPPCPKGPQPKDKVIRICCFAGAHVAMLDNMNPPGPFGELPDLSFIFGPMPMGMITRPIGPVCVDLNAEASKLLLAMMRKAFENLKNMGRLNEAQTQEGAIKCFEAVCKEFGWL